MRRVTKKLTMVLSALFIVALSSLTVIMIMWDREVMSNNWTAEEPPPENWRGTLRSLSQLPQALVDLRPDSATGANAAELLLQRFGSRDDRSGSYPTLFTKLRDSLALSTEDSVALNQIAVDSLLQRYVTASGREYYSSFEIAKEWNGETILEQFSVPSYQAVRAGTFGLLVRARSKFEIGESEEALADILAVLRVGDLMYRGSAFFFGTSEALSALKNGAAELGRYAEATDNDQWRAAAAAIAQWRDTLSTSGLEGVLALPSDSLIGLARDSRVPIVWRIEAIRFAVFTQYRPKNIPIGISRELRASISTLRSVGEPQVAGMAELAELTIDRFNGEGIANRWRWIASLY